MGSVDVPICKPLSYWIPNEVDHLFYHKINQTSSAKTNHICTNQLTSELVLAKE